MIYHVENRLQKMIKDTIGERKWDTLNGRLSSIRHPLQKRKRINDLKELIKGISDIPNMKIWNDCHAKLLKRYNTDRYYELCAAFYENQLIRIKEVENNETKDPIVVCMVKDDVVRIAEILMHYRRLGVNSFVFIDNGSSDGTLELLLEQEDTEIWRTKEDYNSTRKTAWINRVIAEKGLHRWYLIVDSDEFFVYPEMGEYSLVEYCDNLKKKNRLFIKTLLLELYPKGALLDKKKNDSDFLTEYTYFDPDGDDYRMDTVSGRLYGGVHRRIFGYDYFLRSKIPLLYYDGSRFSISSHTIFPSYEDCTNEINGILLHYKWLPSEREKLEKIAQEGKYYDDSNYYKRYLETFKDGTSLYMSGSKKWIGVESFQELPFITSAASGVWI